MHAINSITRWSRTCDRPLIIPDQRSKIESDILYTHFYYIFSDEIPGFFFHGINVKSSHAVLFILWKYQISCKNVNPMKFLRVERNKFKIQRKCYKQKFNVWIRRIWYYIIRETVLNICKNIFKKPGLTREIYSIFNVKPLNFLYIYIRYICLKTLILISWGKFN